MNPKSSDGEKPPHSGLELVKAMRPHQWAKNLLIGVAPLLGQRLFLPSVWKEAGLAFIAFSLVASSVYLINDINDVEADRRHPAKKYRPLARGSLSASAAAATAALLLILGLSFTLPLPRLTTGLLSSYWLLSGLYTWKLKKIPFLDVIFLAGFYSLRLYSGAAATQTDVSDWLMAFSLFIFFSLALLKRFTALNQAAPDPISAPTYNQTHSHLIPRLGLASGLMSLAVFGFYLRSETVQELYQQSIYLYGLIPVFAFWLGRMWKKAKGKQMHSDPLVFALSDPLSLGCGFFCVLLVVSAL